MKKLFILTAIAFAAMPAASLAQKTAEKSGGISIRYEGEVNVGFGLGGKLKMDGQSADAKYSRPFIETIHGVRIARYAFVGLGVGFQYAYDNWKVGMMPLFVDLKGCYPVTENFAPYIAVDLGFGMGVTGTKNFGSKLYEEGEGIDLKGGFYASYGLGINYKRFNLGLGLQHQGMKFKSGGESSEGFSVNSFFVKIGVKF
jgi:opacity protein-like surface antigen